MRKSVELTNNLGGAFTLYIARCWRSIKNNLDAIGCVVILLSPLTALYFKSNRYSVISGIVVILCGMSLVMLDKAIHNKQYGIPVMRKHFVKYNKENDSVHISTDDLHEIANYLYDLQEYFDGRGML